MMLHQPYFATVDEGRMRISLEGSEDGGDK